MDDYYLCANCAFSTREVSEKQDHEEQTDHVMVEVEWGPSAVVR